MRKILFFVILFVLPFLLSMLILSCTLEQPYYTEEGTVEETVEDKEAVQKKAVETINGEEDLSFSYTNEFPEIWDKVRIVEPLLANFQDIKVKENNGIVSIGGEIEGESEIKYCMNPDIGIFTKVSALILGSNGEIKWTPQEPQDKGVYVGVVEEGDSPSPITTENALG